MAPLAARLASARAVAGHSRIRPTTIESALGTVRTVDTLRALRRHYPHYRFVWLMGADNLAQFHLWSEWRTIARLVPIVVLARPGYMGRSHSAPAFGWLRHYLHRDPTGWRDWQLPAIVILNLGLDRRSATAVRRRRPQWAATLTSDHPEDPQA
jgi:nicotinate-nucleotide adenylyltransferase